MARKQFNSVDGYTVGGNASISVVDANANVTAAALTANGNVGFTGSNVSLGNVSNLKVTGGSTGQYLQTDGTGNLVWNSISVGTSIANGNSNVSIPTANGNITLSVSGNANVLTVTGNALFRNSYNITGFVYQSNTAPASPQNGDQWYNTFNGILFEYLNDGDSSQWVDISSLPLPNLSTSNASAVLNNVQSTGTYFPAFISSTANGNYALSSNTAFSANLANGAMIATTFVGALSGAATSATTAGTVTTAAQPNITSVSTSFTSLTFANAQTITANNITFSAGSNTNLGTFTGNFSLSAGSRLNATYADLAENYAADATYEPGTVLLFGGEQEVTLANAFDSTKVAGVVTTNPAYSMNSALEAEHVAEIALQGRVPCKVIGPIEKGDLMVSASNGHATANNDARAGTIIGKALENFNGDFGVIEVAVGRF